MNLKVFGVHAVMELSPVLLAVRRMGGEVPYGGVAHVIGQGHLLQAQAGVPGVVDREPPMARGGGGADIGCNAETQLLRLSVDRPDLRVILTATESLYRIVARRSSGIASFSDLRGKRIATFPRTSAAFFLADVLADAGMSESDVVVVPAAPADEVAAMVVDGRVDAAAIWEPAGENAFRALGADAIAFRPTGAYRMLFGLNTLAGTLADPEKRSEMVELVRQIARASRDIDSDPDLGILPTAAISGYPEAEVRACWRHHVFPAYLAPDLLDVLEREERWIAVEQARAPRSRAELATLIDDSVLREALGG